MSALDDLVVRRATVDDLPAVVDLGRRCSGSTGDAAFLEWKHLQNPFGASPMWVACQGERVVAFRAFMRWELAARDRVIHAGRAVDTAVDPDLPGSDVVTALTRHGLDALAAQDVTLVFSTVDGRRRSGDPDMGWEEVGRLGVVVRPHSGRFPLVVRAARGAAEQLPVPTDVGDAPADVFGQESAVQALLDDLAPVGAPVGPGGVGGQLTTRRSPAFLAWRYGQPARGYRVLLQGPSPADGLVVFRRRRRGRAVETVLCDVLVPSGGRAAKLEEHLVDRVGKAADSDYFLRLDQRRVTRGPFVRLPRVGPVLVCRTLDESSVPGLPAWGLTMGDVELF